MISLLLCMILSEPVEPNYLFAPVSDDIKLTERQQKLFDRFMQIPTYKNHVLVKLNSSALEQKSFVIHAKEQDLTVAEFTQDIKLEYRYVRWGDSSLLHIGLFGCNGLVYDKKKVYAVLDLSEGLHMVVEVDHSKFQKD